MQEELKNVIIAKTLGIIRIKLNLIFIKNELSHHFIIFIILAVTSYKSQI